MENTIESFKENVDLCQDELDIDNLCFRWLRLTALEYGERGEVARKLLALVEELLDPHH